MGRPSGGPPLSSGVAGCGVTSGVASGRRTVAGGAIATVAPAGPLGGVLPFESVGCGVEFAPVRSRLLIAKFDPDVCRKGSTGAWQATF